MLMGSGGDRVVGGSEYVLMIIIAVEGSELGRKQVRDLQGSLCVNGI